MSTTANHISLGWGAPAPPKPSVPLAIAATVLVGLIAGLAWVALMGLRVLLVKHAMASALADFVIVVAGGACLCLVVPLACAWLASQQAVVLTRANDLAAARAASATSRDWSLITFGYGAVVMLALGMVAFFCANDAEVAKTFFDIGLIVQFTPLVAFAFLNNVMIFMVTEVLVLVWGLIVAVARILPGEAGRPLRMIATLYCDVFRGFPAIITIYLIGFGLPLAGVPLLGNLPLTGYAIIALTIVYGAYVAEVYRAGIESVHGSQMAAARSLGLSYVQAMRFVMVPQAIRRIVPPLLNDFIGLQKDTSLVMVIGVLDGFAQSRIIASNHFNLSAVTIVGLLFVFITIPQARLVDRLAEADQRRMRAGGG